MRFSLLFLSLPFCIFAHLPTVLQTGEDPNEIFVSHGLSKLWETGDRICLIEQKNIVACGTVVTALDEGAWAKVNPTRAAINVTYRDGNRNHSYSEGIITPKISSWVGLEARRARLKQRNPGPPITETPKEMVPQTKQVPVQQIQAQPKIGETQKSIFSLGFNYVFPFFHYQYLLSENWSLGLGGLLFDHNGNNSTQMKGFGGFAAIDFHGDKNYQGLWGELAIGSYSLTFASPEGEQAKSILALLAHLGWRWRWESGPAFGFGAGVHRLWLAHEEVALVGTHGWFPSLAMEVGFLF